MQATAAMAQAASETGGFNWATVIASVAGSAIVAITAFTGVILTQRNERRKAHDDRVWELRVDAYTEVFKWTDGWWNIYGGVELDSEAVPPKKISSDAYWKLEMFGSPKVVEACEMAFFHRKTDLERMPNEIARLYGGVNSETRSALFHVMECIQAETRGQPSWRRGRER